MRLLSDYRMNMLRKVFYQPVLRKDATMNVSLKGVENDSKKQKVVDKDMTREICVDATGRSASVGARVKKLRLALGYTRPAFADAIGVSASAAHAWENEGAQPSPSVVDSICRTFAVDKNWLTTGAGRPFPDFMNAAPSFLLCPRTPFLRDESVPFDSKTRDKTRRFVAALTPRQRSRALLFYTDLVAALAMIDANDVNQSGALDAS